MVHGSDSNESAAREAAMFFPGPTDRLVLASRSPQRRAILEQLGVAFDVVVSDARSCSTGAPVEVAVENARRKALRCHASTSRPSVVLGVDTVVVSMG